MKYLCPVCGYGMSETPRDYHICPSCGTEFGLHDQNATIEELRRAWVSTGPKWWSKTDQQPLSWNPFLQLLNIVEVTSVSTSSVEQKVDNWNFNKTGTDFGVEPKADPFDWAGRTWGRKPGDMQPA
jgi:hypothetical protein